MFKKQWIVDKKTSNVDVTFHTGSAAVFFRGGALKLSIRFRAAENKNIKI